MKVLLASFQLESNEHVHGLTELDRFSLKFGDNLLSSMHVKDIFEQNDIELIPGILANAYSGTVLSKEAFAYIESKLIRIIKTHLAELDGIYLAFHGASKVEDLPEGSGDRHLLKQIRKITGPHLPIFVTMDPHGNLTHEYVSLMTYGRCFRESPHTDLVDTYRHVAHQMVNHLKNRQTLTPIYKKLPFVLGGERSVSTDEPMRSINKKLDELEQDHRILSASFHVGYLRHDNYAAGSGLILVPSQMKYREYAIEKINELHDYCVSKYSEFHYHGNALSDDEAVLQSINLNHAHIVVTDSGDNVTSGAMGNNTHLLKKYLNLNDYNQKKILVAAITDEQTFNSLQQVPIEDKVTIHLGNSLDELSQSVEIEVQVKQRGNLQQIFGDTSNFGETITLSILNKPIDLVIIDKPISFAEKHQFEAANLSMSDYQIIVVKQGYIFPELNEFADYAIMALTDGATNQRTEDLVFKQIQRPMLPFDSIDSILKEKLHDHFYSKG